MCILRDKIKNAIQNDSTLLDKFEKYKTTLNNCIGFKGGYKLVMGSSNKDYFEHYVQSSESDYGEDVLNKKVKTAHSLLNELIDGYVNERDEVQALITLTDVITQRISITEIDTDDEELAFVFFERLNTRGRALVPADLLKNYLFGRTNVDNADLKTSWAQMVNKLNSSGDDDPSNFIRYYWNSMNNKTSLNNLYSDVVKEFKDHKDEMFSFFRKMLKTVDFYVFINKPNDGGFGNLSPKTVDYLKNLRMIGYQTFIPLLISLYNRNTPPGDFERVLRSIEKLSVRNMIERGNPNFMEVLYSELARKYSEGSVTIADICSKINDKCPPDSIIKPKFKVFSIKNDNEGKMLLKTMHNRLHSPEDMIIVPEGLYMHLEHIMPQTKGKWEIDDEIWMKYKNYLGNTTLLFWSKNLSIKNKPFDEKKERAYSKSSIKYTKDLIKYEQWTEVEIKKRQERLLKDFLKVWPEIDES